MILQHVVPKRFAVLHTEPVAPVIAHPTELRGAGLWVDLAGVGIEAEVARTEFDLLSGDLALDAGALVVVHGVGTASAVDPAIHAPAQAIHPKLLIALGEAREQHFLLAVRFDEQHVGCGGDECTIPPSEDAGGKVQVIDHDLALLVTTTLVRFGENDHSPAGLALAIHAQRIVRHFDDPQVARVIPIKSHGVQHHRLGSDERCSEALAQVELGPGGFGREWLGDGECGL